MIEALPERILKPFRIAASGIVDPALLTSLEKPGLVYGSTIDSRQQFPVSDVPSCLLAVQAKGEFRF